jgi:hypothetical protein
MSQNSERFKEGQSTERPDEAILKEGNTTFPLLHPLGLLD